MKVIIGVGLPASGKTTFLKELDGKYLNLDNVLVSQRLRELDKGYNHENVIIDSLFCSISNIQKLIDSISYKHLISELEVHLWEKDIEACLHNDLYRRSKSSQISIQNMEIEDITLEKLQDIFPNLKVKVEKHDIVRKPDWKVFAHRFELGDETIYISDSWTTSGQWRNCWGESGEVTPDEQPEFTKLDKILEEVSSNITYLRYKKLMNTCVSENDKYYYGYYGAYTNEKMYVLDIEELYNFLVVNNLYSIED